MTTPASSIERDESPARLDELIERARQSEVPAADVCLDLARAYSEIGNTLEAFSWATRVVDAGWDYPSWDAAARVLTRISKLDLPEPKRRARLAVLGSYTTSQLVDLVKLVAARRDIGLEIYEAGFAQYQQEVLDENSGLWEFEPDYVLLTVHEGELRLPDFSENPTEDVEHELARWTSLWDTVSTRSSAKVIQTNFVARSEDPFGHLSARLPGTRRSMIGALNARLGQTAGENVAILDCDHLAAVLGHRDWFDDRYWHFSKQAIGLKSLPLVVDHFVALLASEMGMSRKCLVLDLDGTLWGGVLGEEGLENLVLGHGPEGEAYVAFQDFILSLKNRGIVLAVCSKNDEELAREAFESHPSMRLTMDDISIFVANWRPKPENVEQIARDLDLGLDSMVFIDDNPAERAAVRWHLPEVDVLTLPDDPAGFVEVLARYPYFAMSLFTPEDKKRTTQYRARAQAASLKATTNSLEEYLRELEMEATLRSFDAFHLPRVVQLIGKTNQFNLTGRRHTRAEIESMMDGAAFTHFYVSLRDLFGDHGLVGVAIGRKLDSELEIDTLLMSCRVIGRTLESAMLAELYDRALEMGCTRLRGVYRASSRNQLVKDLYPRLGFREAESNSDGYEWIYELSKGRFESPFIEVVRNDQ